MYDLMVEFIAFSLMLVIVVSFAMVCLGLSLRVMMWALGEDRVTGWVDLLLIRITSGKKENYYDG